MLQKFLSFISFLFQKTFNNPIKVNFLLKKILIGFLKINGVQNQLNLTFDTALTIFASLLF